MTTTSPRLKCSRLVAALVATLMCIASVWSEAPAQVPGAGRVVGHIDGIRFEGEQFRISGWACQQGIKDSIDIHVYADRSAYDTPRGTLVLTGVANLPNEPAVDRACEDQGGNHRFVINLANAVLTTYQGRKLFVHGIRKKEGVPNAALDGSGAMKFPSPTIFRAMPDSFPPLAGAYTSSAQHPRVFTTPAELNDLVARINRPGLFSAQRFSALANQVKADLGSKVDWDATYSGCDIEIYLHGFSYEPRGGYAAEIRTEDQLRAAMNVKPGAEAPAGAAVVASRLALYGALIKAGAAAPAGAPNADQAIALSKRILLAWADRGFRDERGSLRQSTSQFCNGRDSARAVAIALQVSRGVTYSVHAQDLLEGLRAFSHDEETRLNTFHGAMYEAIRTTSNEEFTYNLAAKYPDEVYNNQFASHLIGLLATARLLDDEKRFYAALYGGEGAAAVRLPWTKLFNYVVYGVSDKPLLRISPNTSDDPLKSNPAYTTKVVAPGEINDRYRNATPLQGMGYPVFTLEGLFTAAEIMRNAGIDAYGYRGAHQQSIEMATEYYACYGKYVGFKKTVTSENARACPDYSQYVGKVVNDVETVILLGAYRFPGNAAIVELEAAAKAEAARDRLDTVRFGRWRD